MFERFSGSPWQMIWVFILGFFALISLRIDYKHVHLILLINPFGYIDIIGHSYPFLSILIRSYPLIISYQIYPAIQSTQVAAKAAPKVREIVAFANGWINDCNNQGYE